MQLTSTPRIGIKILNDPAMTILHLTLKHEWFHAIDNGSKTEEYREVKPYWITRLVNCNYPQEEAGENSIIPENITFDIFENKHDPYQVLKAYHCTLKTFTHVIFKNGYGKNCPTMGFALQSLSIGKGNPQWGAPADDVVFILKLASRMSAEEITQALAPQPKHKFKRLKGVTHTVMSRCEHCGQEREGVKGEYTYLTKRLNPVSGNFFIRHSDQIPPCKRKTEKGVNNN